MRQYKLSELLKSYSIVIYDGECGFCDTSVQFILDQGPSDKVRFVAFQSEIGQLIRKKLNISASLDSIIIVENYSYYKKSKAIFKILKHISSPWRFLQVFAVIPSFISDFFYDLIARNRHDIMPSSCRLLTAEERKYFI